MLVLRPQMRFLLAVLLPLFALVVPLLATLETPTRHVSLQQDEKGPRSSFAEEEAQRYTLPTEKHERAIAYNRVRYRLYFLGFLYQLAVLLIILLLRIAPRFRNLAERFSRRRLAQAMVFTPPLFLTLGILSLPTAIYRQSLYLTYDQSVQSWLSWFWDWGKTQLIAVVVGTFLVWILYGVMRRSRQHWWFYFWLVSIPIFTFFLFIHPYVIQPLYMKFEPLGQERPELVQEVQKVVARAGLDIRPERMYEVKASEKYNLLSAYVTGLGASRRLVILDTTLEKLSLPQILFVFGHEMGHYVLGYIYHRLILFSGLALVFLYFGYLLLHWALKRWGEQWAIRSAQDWASLPVLLLFFVLFSFLSTPLTHAFNRYIEHQADIYGLEVIHGIVSEPRKGAVETFQIMGEVNLMDPHPNWLIKFWLLDHPPLQERILFVQTYNPWAQGKDPKYVSSP
ncbi:M48 family metallopeptidase [Acidobacteria bacterium AH-259-G07]|nr:M48 family metallopeptidase [Acidobacteria bacterium AH-259-G07]